MNYIEYMQEGGQTLTISLPSNQRAKKLDRSKMIKEGKIPKGKKRQGFKELSWTKEQLNIIKNEL